MASRIATFEVREALWIREKVELESKLKEAIVAETSAKQRLHRLQEQQKQTSIEEAIKKEHLVSLFTVCSGQYLVYSLSPMLALLDDSGVFFVVMGMVRRASGRVIFHTSIVCLLSEL